MVEPSTYLGDAPEEGEEESRLLLRFSSQRDPGMVADWVSFNVIDTERQDWARGWANLKKFSQREGHAQVPYDHREGSYPLGAWVSEQRRAYKAGQMNGTRARRLEALGMAWKAADDRFLENLAAARVYMAKHWTLCAPRDAMVLDRPVSQWLSNLRRPGALEGRPEWAAALAELDEDWNPSWPVVWQRHFGALRDLVRDEEGPAVVEPGVTVHGMDIGRWLAQQRRPQVWAALTDGQRERLEDVGVVPPAPEVEAPPTIETAAEEEASAAAQAPRGAFERGVAALAQYRARTGSVTVPRGHVEALAGGVEVKLGVWLSNTKSRQAGLAPERRAALTDLGLEWAAAEGAV
ncbi:helicase associated domain-containing protein [Streptomyces sp. NPDC058757]|uniref:helicase associated domain-containing protein n=1 Tax=unclassified Streptomyces TaxID=2593676 RepID=UPI0036A143F2